MPLHDLKPTWLSLPILLCISAAYARTASRFAIVIVTAVLALAYVDEAHSATTCPGTKTGISVNDSNGSAVYSNCAFGTGHVIMSWSSSVVTMVQRASNTLTPAPDATLSVGTGFAGRQIQNMGSGYSGDCTEVAFTSAGGQLPNPNADTVVCGVERSTSGNNIYIRATFTNSTKMLSSPSIVYGTAAATPPTVTAISPNTGPIAGGTAVTITGTNFTGATAVTIGGVAATGITVVSATSITATTPAGTAGAKDIVVTTPGGSGTGTGLFTYEAAPSNPLEDKEVLGLIKAQTDTVVRVAGQSMSSVNGRLTQLISAPRDSLVNNSHQGVRLSIADANLNGVLSSTGLMSGLNSSADIFNNGWAIWTEGSVVVGSGRGNSDFNIGGITVGVDKRITPMLTAGLALRIAQEDSDVGTASSVDTNSYSATAYGSYALSNTKYIQGAFGYSDIDISSERVSNADVFKGSRDAEQVYMSLSLTKQFDYMGLTLLPYGSFDGSYSTLDAYSESGVGATLTYHKQHIKTLAATLGLRGNYVIQQSNGLFVPRFHINYQGGINSDSNVAVNYVSVPSTTYKTSFDGISSSSWLLGLGFGYQRNNVNFSADYERTEQINWGHSDTIRLMLNATF